eukprot:UN02776
MLYDTKVRILNNVNTLSDVIEQQDKKLNEKESDRVLIDTIGCYKYFAKMNPATLKNLILTHLAVEDNPNYESLYQIIRQGEKTKSEQKFDLFAKLLNNILIGDYNLEFTHSLLQNIHDYMTISAMDVDYTIELSSKWGHLLPKQP